MRKLCKTLIENCNNLTLKLNSSIKQIFFQNGLWCVFDSQNKLKAQAPVLILANAGDVLNLLPTVNSTTLFPLTALRGQMVFGKNTKNFNAQLDLPSPINGRGHLIPALPTQQNWDWGMGSSFERGDTDCKIRNSSIDENWHKLQFLSPTIASALEEQFKNYQLQSFVDIRYASKDHLPLVGAVPKVEEINFKKANQYDYQNLPRYENLYIISGFGSRGLCLAAISAELLISQLNQQPAPLPNNLIKALDPARFLLRLTREQKNINHTK